jgi:hypothetical protein
MLKNATATTLLLLLLFGISFQTAFARDNKDWNNIIARVNSEVAVKMTDGKFLFGKLNSANDSEITVQLADKKTLTTQTLTIPKSEVKKAWTAKLIFGKKLGTSAATAIGAGAGAGVGYGAGWGLLAATGGSDAGYEILAITTAVGAGLGAAIGYFAGRGGHKKLDVIYQN